MSDKKRAAVPILVARVSLAVMVAWIVGFTLDSAYAAETTNRIAANKLSSNRIAANRLAANRIAEHKISSNRLQVNPATAALLATADGRELYSYIMSCALPEGTTIEAIIASAENTAPPDTLYTCTNERCVFPGSIGLAPYWIERPLDSKGQRWITACLLARVNLYGVSVKISLRGVAPELYVSPHEAKTYSLEEGGFYGNIFGDPDQPLDWNACRGKDQAEGERGGLEMRDCTEPDPNDPSHTKCGFQYAGDCGNYTQFSTERQACHSFDTQEDTYGDCLAPQGDGRGPTSGIYREVITTYVKQ